MVCLPDCSFGAQSCYPLAFGLPAVLMLIATMVFLFGSKLYVKVPPGGNVVVKIASVVYTAIREKRKAHSSYPIHWLEYATYAYPEELIRDTQAVLSVLKIFAPIPLFWMLYDQQASSWVDQAWRMDGRVNLFGWKFTVEPAQMQTWNAVLILVMIPLFEKGVYPMLRRMGVPFKALSRMQAGILLAVLSFVMSAIVQVFVDRGTFQPSAKDPAILVCVQNCTHMFAQIPQIVVITAAEILLSITGLEFAYSQAPSSMKSVCQAAWLLTVAVGNLMVVVINEINIFKRLNVRNPEVWEYILYAGILGIGSIAFELLSRSYRYLEDRHVPDAVVSQRQPGLEDDGLIKVQ
jgi:dipeptide/tripeptide permease